MKFSKISVEKKTNSAVSVSAGLFFRGGGDKIVRLHRFYGIGERVLAGSSNDASHRFTWFLKKVEIMKNVVFPFRIWTAVVCVVMSVMWHSDASVAGIVTFGSGGNAFNMEFVAIGNPGNADDTTGNPTTAGKVDYAYQMGKFEVSEDMITKFNASQTLQITKDTRGTDKPATSVSWNEAARFVNWLNKSTGGYEAYNFTTGGVNDNITPWTISNLDDYDASNPYRSLRTNYVLPSMDEWYKAAYYNPVTSTYSDFPNGLDMAPTVVASGTAANTAVYNQTFHQGPADITLAGGLSPYGIMGLGGNVAEWEETEFSLNNSSGLSARGIRGGFWLSDSLNLSSSSRSNFVPAGVDNTPLFGFRVASLSSDAVAVPEPSSLIMFSTMALSALWYRKRLRK